MGCYLILVAKERVLSGAIELAVLQPRLGFGDGPLFGRPELSEDEKPNRILACLHQLVQIESGKRPTEDI